MRKFVHSYASKKNMMLLNKMKAGCCLLGIIALASCKEIGPAIDFGGGAPATDTTFLATAETATERKVLMEEFTGVSCPPCPAGHDIVKNLKTQYPGRIIVVAYHVRNIPQAAPTDHSLYDFRTDDATDVGKLFGLGSLPNAAIDRSQTNNTYLYESTTWSGQMSNRMQLASPVNISLASLYNSDSREVTLNIHVAYTASVSKKQVLNVALIQDGIIDAQKSGLQLEEDYEHNYVLRDMVTPISGTPIMDAFATKEPGRVYERIMKIKVDPAWDPVHCQLVVFVSNADGADKEVQQVAEVKVIP